MGKGARNPAKKSINPKVVTFTVMACVLFPYKMAGLCANQVFRCKGKVSSFIKERKKIVSLFENKQSGRRKTTQALLSQNSHEEEALPNDLYTLST